MQLIGYLDSPFVRRVAITMRFLDIPFEHRELSIFRDFEEFRGINPLVKVPTLVLDDDRVLSDSTLIIDYLETYVAGQSLMPEDRQNYLSALQSIGVALVGMEKVAQLVYETSQRPPERQHGPWRRRLEQQVEGAAGLMESTVADSATSGNKWLLGESISQADITMAVAWRFMLHTDCVKFGDREFPALAKYSIRAEALPEFLAFPLSG